MAQLHTDITISDRIPSHVRALSLLALHVGLMHFTTSPKHLQCLGEQALSNPLFWERRLSDVWADLLATLGHHVRLALAGCSQKHTTGCV